MAKCIVCGVEVGQGQIKECEKEGTYGIYCSQCLSNLTVTNLQPASNTSSNSN